MTETDVGRRETTLSAAELDLLDAYWRAANYLSVGQIYLLDNPLLREPLRAEHVKPRLLGHWGTTPGLNLIYVHLNRARSGCARTPAVQTSVLVRMWFPPPSVTACASALSSVVRV